MPAPSGRLRRHVRAALPLVAVLVLLAVPASADTATALQSSVDQARSAAQQAQAQAAAADTLLGSAQQNLAAVQRRLADLQNQIVALDARIQGDTETVDALTARVHRDKQILGTFLRTSYEQGGDAALLYVLTASDISSAFDREASVDRVATAYHQLVDRIQSEQDQAVATLHEAQQARADVDVVREQAATEEQLLAIQEQQVAAAAAAAHAAADAAQQNLTATLQQQAAAAAARARAGIIFAPLPGATFTPDTDLTKPSGETADRLNAFLKGTAFDGLGGAYMAAEQKYHVSARYLLAHSIEESAFGTSQIAVDKHNIFGYGADDTHPYADAMSFPTFAACIDYVAGKVASNYLDPAGAYYHGPTLRGMNVSYASDPNWANNIARIADSFP